MICKQCGHVVTSDFLTISQAADLLQVTPARVLQLVKAGRIADAGRVGPAHLVDRQSVESLAAARALDPPKAGRPRKAVAS
jgi:hypothetical protein